MTWSASRVASVAVLTLGLALGCSAEGVGGGDDGSGFQASPGLPLSCMPNAVRECPCEQGGSGTQSCLPTGDGYGLCGPCAALPPQSAAGSDAPAMRTDGALDMTDAAVPDGDMGGDMGAAVDAGIDSGASEPVAEASAVGTSCGVGLPALCDLEAEKCCVRSLRTDTCIGISDSCDCDLPNCSVMEARCDGPEDCPDGQVCCGTLAGSSYQRFECATSCDYAGTQRIACHQDGPACPGNNVCANSQLLTNLQVCIDPATIQQ